MILRNALDQVRRRRMRQDHSAFAALIDTPGDLGAGVALPANCELFVSTDSVLGADDELVVIGNAAASDRIRKPLVDDGAADTPMTGWTQLNPAAGVIGKAGSVFTSTGTTAAASIDADCTRDHYASAIMTGLSNAGVTKLQGVICRASNDLNALRDFYAFYFKDNAVSIRTWNLSKFLNGTETVLATGTMAVLATDTVEMEAQGTTLRGYVSGVLKSTQTDSSLASGQPGLLLTAGQTLDSIEFGRILKFNKTITSPAGAANAKHRLGWFERGRVVSKAAGAPGTVSVYAASQFGNSILIATG